MMGLGVPEGIEEPFLAICEAVWVTEQIEEHVREAQRE